MRRRVALLLALTVAGIAMGVLGDVFTSPIPIDFGAIAAGIVLSPLVVTFGGGHVSIQGAEDLFFLGGLFFWPAYAALSFLWLRFGMIPPLVFVLPWTAQGFFEIGLRMAVLSGV